MAGEATPPPDGANLKGHGGPVKVVRVSADGQRVLSGSFDYSMIQWALDEEGAGTLVRRFEDHGGAVNAVAFVPGSARAIAAGDDGAVTLWDLESGKVQHVFSGHTAKVMGAAVSPDGRRAVTASWDRTGRIWDLANHRAGPVLKGHKGPVNAVVYSRDGRRIFTSSYDGSIGIWEAESGAFQGPLYRHGWGINVLALLPDGKSLIFGALDGTVGVVDIATGALVRKLEAYERPVLSVAVIDKPGLAATGGGDGVIRVWRTGDWSLIEEYRNPFGPIWALDFARYGSRIYFGGLDDFITAWQVSPRKPFETTESKFPRRFQIGNNVSPGEKQFARKCSICHTLEKNGKNRAGPTLYGLFGRRMGSLPGYPYSPALRKGGIVWNEETIRKLFTLGPEHFTPGTKMPLQRIKDPAKIDALIDYLRVATVPGGAKSEPDAQ